MVTLGCCIPSAQVSNAIREGAEGYFATQYGTIGRLALVLGGLVYLVYMFRRETPEQAEAGLTRCGAASSKLSWAALGARSIYGARVGEHASKGQGWAGCLHSVTLPTSACSPPGPLAGP